MPRQWEKIREKRLDLTDWVIHWTRWQNVDGQHYRAFDVLKHILQCGWLRPTFAPKTSATVGGKENTIKGKDPAVCFTEQPLNFFITSCTHDESGRYHPYAVAVHKWHLYEYGGRPVLYGDEKLFRDLPPQYQYLWVHYQPVPESEFQGYPLDFTHEREWRAKVKPFTYLRLGPAPTEGVPLMLPPVYVKDEWQSQYPIVLVETVVKARELKCWLQQLPPYSGSNKFLARYFQKLPSIAIVPLEEVKKNIEKGDEKWYRLETLPIDDLARSIQNGE